MFDSHAHYDDKAFNQDRDEVLNLVYQDGVKYIVNAGSSVKSSKTCVELSKKFDFVFAAIGVHPHDASRVSENYLSSIEDLSKYEKVVAIGEIGLDYHYDFSPRDVQKKCFIEQINLAKHLNLPIIVHDREAHEDVIKILRQEKAETAGGVMHCFSGSLELARETVKMGMYLGIGGSVTFSNAKKTLEVVKNIPLEYLVSETDCPYLTPVPHRGKRNDSRYMKHVIEKIAEIKGLTFEETSGKLTENAKRLFKIV